MMPYRLEIGEQSGHLETARIGRILEAVVTQRMLDTVILYGGPQGADSYEAAFVRDPHTRIGNVVIGLRRAGELVGFVANEENPFFCPTVDGWIYNQGPKVTISESK